jgi:hypothetical protein
MQKLHWPSPPVITFFQFQNFPISLSDFYLILLLVKSDNEIGKFGYGMSQADLTIEFHPAR